MNAVFINQSVKTKKNSEEAPKYQQKEHKMADVTRSVSESVRLRGSCVTLPLACYERVRQGRLHTHMRDLRERIANVLLCEFVLIDCSDTAFYVR